MASNPPPPPPPPKGARQQQQQQPPSQPPREVVGGGGLEHSKPLVNVAPAAPGIARGIIGAPPAASSAAPAAPAPPPPPRPAAPPTHMQQPPPPVSTTIAPPAPASQTVPAASGLVAPPPWQAASGAAGAGAAPQPPPSRPPAPPPPQQQQAVPPPQQAPPYEAQHGGYSYPAQPQQQQQPPPPPGGGGVPVVVRGLEVHPPPQGVPILPPASLPGPGAPPPPPPSSQQQQMRGTTAPPVPPPPVQYAPAVPPPAVNPYPGGLAPPPVQPSTMAAAATVPPPVPGSPAAAVARPPPPSGKPPPVSISPGGGIEVGLAPPPVPRGKRPSATTTTVTMTPPPRGIKSKSAPASPQGGDASPGTRSLESEADAFMAGPSHRSARGLSPLVRPGGLPPSQTDLDRVRTLGRRRAWGDVLKLSNELLGRSGSVYMRHHSSLIHGTAVRGRGNEEAGGTAAKTTKERMEMAEILSLRFMAMLKLRRYGDLGREVDRLNLLEDEVKDGDGSIDSSSDDSGGGDGATGSKKGSIPFWVPWGLRILAAETLQYTAKPQLSIDALHRMRERLEQGNANDEGHHSATTDAAAHGDAIWLVRVNNALANAFTRQGEYRLVLSALEDLMDLLPNAARIYVASKLAENASKSKNNATGKRPDANLPKTDDPANNDDDGKKARQRKMLELAILDSFRVEVLSRQGRALLQVGALPEAGVVFQSAKECLLSVLRSMAALRTSDGEGAGGYNGDVVNQILDASTSIRRAPAQVLLNEGLLHFARQEYKSALGKFDEALRLSREEQTKEDPSSLSASIGGAPEPPFFDEYLAPTLVLPTTDTLLNQCLNNAALCALYTCRMHSAVDMMEALVREDPTLYLTEGMAFNLCTLYELGSDNNLSAKRKKVLQLVAKRFFLHDIGPESFRIN